MAKRGRPFKHEMLSNPAGLALLKFAVGEECCKRSMRNLCYRQNVFRALQAMQLSKDKPVQEAEKFWTDRLKKMQGLKMLLYELGKFSDIVDIGNLLIESHELIRDGKMTIARLKQCIVVIRRSASKTTDD